MNPYQCRSSMDSFVSNGEMNSILVHTLPFNEGCRVGVCASKDSRGVHARRSLVASHCRREINLAWRTKCAMACVCPLNDKRLAYDRDYGSRPTTDASPQMVIRACSFPSNGWTRVPIQVAICISPVLNPG